MYFDPKTVFSPTSFEPFSYGQMSFQGKHAGTRSLSHLGYGHNQIGLCFSAIENVEFVFLNLVIVTRMLQEFYGLITIQITGTINDFLIVKLLFLILLEESIIYIINVPLNLLSSSSRLPENCIIKPYYN